MKTLLSIAFLLINLLTFATEGSSFDNAIEINPNDTITFPAEQKTLYYTFTISKPQVLFIPVSENFSAKAFTQEQSEFTYSFDGRLKYYIEAGTYFISIENQTNNSFSWNICTRDAFAGEYCQVPYELTESGKVTFSGTKYESFYCSYNASKSGRICFKNIPYSKVEIFDQCGGQSLFKKLDINAFSFEVEAEKSYIIEIYHDLIPGFVFDFYIANNRTESCSQALELTNYGTITTPIGSGFCYYAFTAPETGVYKITTDNVADNEGKQNSINVRNLKLFENCQQASYDDYLDKSIDGTLVFEANQGEYRIIQFEIETDGYSHEPFTWHLEKNIEAGVKCENALHIESPGQIDFPDGKESFYYTYTATHDCKIEITNGDNNERVYIKNHCDDEQWESSGTIGEATIFAKANTPYIIYWESDFYTQEGFIWTIEEVDYAGGENCENPQTIEQPDTINFPANNQKWYYTYTATVDGALRISDGDNNHTVFVYTNCQSLDNMEFNNKGELVISAQKEVIYIIEWNTSQSDSFDWTLTEDIGEPGEVESNPLIITDFGTENTPSSYSINRKGFVYYQYTASNDQQIALSAPLNSARISIWPKDNKNQIQFENSGNLKTPLESGKTYIIRWESLKEQFEWQGFSRELSDGETAFNPIDILNLGQIEYPEGFQMLYYRFTPEQNGVLSITDESDAWSSFTTEIVFAGEPIVFYYYNESETAFSFTLALRDAWQGEFCTNPISATSGSVSTSVSLTNTYMAYTAATSCIVSISNNEDTQGVSIFSDCNYNSENYFSYYGNGGEIALEIEANQTIILSCFNNNALVTYNLSEHAPETGETADNPLAIEQSGAIGFLGTQKNLVKNYYSYSPSKNEKITIGNNCIATVYNTKSNDLLMESYYEEFSFEASKNQSYLLVIERLNNTDETWQFTTEQSQISEQGVSFTITDSQHVLSGIQIQIANQSFSTNENGQVWVPLSNGTYSFSVTSEDFLPVSGNLTLNGYTKEIQILLVPDIIQLYTLTFVVSTDQMTVEGATIVINGTQLKTNNLGNAFAILQAGTYNYSVTAPNFKTQNGTVEISNQDKVVSLELEVSETPTYQIQFNVTDGQLEIEQAIITIAEVQLSTNEEGKAVIELENGTYTYEVAANGFATYNDAITIDGGPQQITVTMLPTYIDENETVSIQIFPNPANDYLKVLSNYPIEQLQLISIDGKTMIYPTIESQTVNLQGINKGYYLLMITRHDTALVKPIIIK